MSEIHTWVSWTYRFSSNSLHAKIRGCVILSCLNLRPPDGSVVSNVSVFVRQEDSWRSQEMPESLRHRAQRPVVHGLPLEESLPTLPGLNRGRGRGRGLRKAINFGLTWWMFYTFWNQKYFVFILFLHFARSIFFYLDVFCRCCFCRTHRGSYDVTLDLEECLHPADSPQVSAASGSVRAPRF